MMQTIGISIVLFALIAVLILDRSKNKWVTGILNWLPAILFAYIIPAIFTYLFRLELSAIPLHGWSKNFIMPLAIIMVMSALSFRQLRAVGVRPVLVFLSGSAAIAIFPVFILLFLSLFTNYFKIEIIDNNYWEGMITMVGSWIGGSTSQLVLKEITNCPESIFLTILVMDNVLVNIWTILMFQAIKKSDVLNKKMGIKDLVPDFIPDEIDANLKKIRGIVLTLTICVISVLITYFLPLSFIMKVLLLSIMGLIFGNIFKFWDHAVVIKVGGFAIILIMAILGLKLNFNNFSLPLAVILFSVIWLVSHYIMMTFMAYVLKLNMAWVPIGSMANVGGISTAPAVTKAYNEELMPHAILLAILSMVSGTYWGLLAVFLFRYFFY